MHSTAVITVVGGSRKLKQQLHSLAAFTVAKLLPKIQHIDITVMLTHLQDTNAYGYCEAVSGPRYDRPRIFEIEIHRVLPLDDMLLTLAHELVHVKQYAQSKLYYSHTKRCNRWNGQWISQQGQSAPWEIEAYSLEKILVENWKQVAHCE